jgi:two-component system chemotaxis sensor kinase CheA
MNENHKEVFKEEAYELLTELETALLELEATPDDKDLIGKAFRAMHTIKGSGAMFGFDDVAEFTHEIETVFDRVREGDIPVTKTLISLTLQARDLIKMMLDRKGGEAPSEPALQEIVSAFRKLVSTDGEGSPATPPADGSSSVQASPPPPKQEISPNAQVTYRLRLSFSHDIFETGTNLLLLLDELRTLGECTVTADTNDIPYLDAINPEYCYTGWDAVLTTDKGIDAIKDVFIFVEDRCEIKIDAIRTDAEEDRRKLGEILVERGDVAYEDVLRILKEKRPLGEVLIEKGITTPDKVDSALAEQQHVKKIQEKTQAKEEIISTIKVPAEKLDVLVNLVGEMVTVQARLSQTASLLHSADLDSIAEEVERLTAELRDNTLNIRMLPIGSTFGRFRRLIRDLSQELGKEIEMTTEGEDTELDKTVIERLNDPLVHLIRNCIDHGIEMPDVRLSTGKPKKGTIHLSAVHSGANVLIKIRDDGKGLDKEAILAKAVEKGLAAPHAELTDREVFNFILEPGFSTAKVVSNVSGRGVGMDVAKKAIDALGGTIEMSTEKGKGTTVTIKLPLTLAIVEGLLVKVAEDHFVLPLSIVEECVELTREDVGKAHGRNMANIRGEIVPYIKLRNEFKILGDSPDIEQIVITGLNGERIGFVVDHVVGEHQTVIKNLGKFYKNVDSVSGATILGDGTVALIVDVAKVVRSVELTEAASN